MTIDVGVQKYDAKKAGMVANYHLDGQAWSDGLTAAGVTPGPTRRGAYDNSASYAKTNYSSKINGVTGAKWAAKFREAMAK